MKTSALYLLSVLSPCWAVPLSAQVQIDELLIAPPFAAGTVFTLSPTGMHLASVHPKGSRVVVEVDGLEGPPFDQVLNAGIGYEPQRFQDDFNLQAERVWSGPVVFSPDGKRHAYAARLGKDVVVMLDHDEIFRAPYSLVVAAANFLHFTPDGRHLLFFNQTSDTLQSFQLMVDGRPATPPFDQTPRPFFSPDGAHWGLLAGKARDPQDRFLIIDGKDAGYVCHQPRFSPRDNRVVCIGGSSGNQSVLVNGKEMMRAPFIKKLVLSPAGDVGVIANGLDQKSHFYLNGKPVVDYAYDVLFSPNGKRWAASCVSPPEAWMVVDGQKQQSYAAVSAAGFSADSTKSVYVAENAGKKFVVVNGQEDEGNALLHIQPIYSATGNAIAYTAGEMMGKLKLHYNDIVDPESYRLFNPTLSPDGRHYVYYGHGDASYTSLVVNGVVKVRASALGSQTFYSPDSKHIAAIVTGGVWVDDQVMASIGTPLGFTADSRHLVRRGTDTDVNGLVLNTYFVDGQLVARFSARNTQWANGKPTVWEQQRDGSIVFVGSDPGPGGYGPMKRITVRMPADGDVRSWIASLNAAAEQAVADAKAAQVKAAEAAAAAQAQRQADAEAAAAKRKADYAAAVAAKLKARQEAAEVKRKARLLYLENLRRAKSGLPALTELPE